MKIREQKIVTSTHAEGLNDSVNKMIAEGWQPLGSHQVVVTHEQNRFRGSEHVDTLVKHEYSQTMVREESPNVIEVGVYCYENEEGKKVYDLEEMMNEFETKVEHLTNTY